MKLKFILTAGTILATALLSSSLMAKDDSDKLDYRVAALEAAVVELQSTVVIEEAEINVLQSELISIQANLAIAEGSIGTLQTDLEALALSPLFNLEPYVYVDLSSLEGVIPYLENMSYRLNVKS